MLLSPLYLQVPLAEMQKIAESRDVARLKLLLQAPSSRDLMEVSFLGATPFLITGTAPWRAVELHAPTGEDYVVLTTQSFCEDVGDLLFRRTDDGKLKYISELDSLGLRIKRHRVDVSLQKGSPTITLTDEVEISRTPAAHCVFRFSPNYIVDTVEESGRRLRFAQAGGIVTTEMPNSYRLTFRYHAPSTVDGAPKVTLAGTSLAGEIWYPTVARRPTRFEVSVRAPREWTSVVTGNLVSTELRGAEKVTSYRCELPLSFMNLVSGGFREVSDRIGGRSYSTWTDANIPLQAMHDQNLIYSKRIAFFSRNFSPYPFQRYGTVASLVNGNDIEGFSFMSWPPSTVPYHDAHEPAHTWWNGIVNFNYLGSVMGEGLATYCDSLYERECEIGNALERRLAYLQPSYGEEDYQQPTSAATAFLGASGIQLSYVKGSIALQQIENEIGSGNMLASLRRFTAKTPPGEEGSWRTLQHAIKEVTGKDASWMFNQWVFGRGRADLTATEVNWETGAVSGRFLCGTGPSRMTCDVLLIYPNGKEKLAKVFIDGNGSRFRVPSPEDPREVICDPYFKLYRKVSAKSLQSTASPNAVKQWFLDPARPDYLRPLQAKLVGKKLTEAPSHLNGTLLIGSPETLPAMRSLCARVGFDVRGNRLTWRGTTIDLDHGSAWAVVNLDGGGKCYMAMGKVRVLPVQPTAQVFLTNELGEFIRGSREPLRTEGMAFKL